jgi:hypothetical protein
VLSYQVDHLLEQLELILGCPHAAADNDALPRPGAQGITDHRHHIIAAVEAKQARLDSDAMLGEPRDSHRDGIGDRLRIPRPGNPVRI